MRDIASSRRRRSPSLQCHSAAVRFVAITVALAAGLVSGAGPVLATDQDNGANGYRKQPAAIVVPVPIGLVLVPFVFNPHSSIVAQAGQRIEDTEFQKLIHDNLVPGGTRLYRDVIIHMAQCFSGGMIDELDDDATITEFNINTAAWWGSPSFGTANGALAPGARNFYSYRWQQEVNAGFPTMLTAYTNAIAPNVDYPNAIRNRERPQYFSRPNGQDAETLIIAPDRNVALMFIGTDADGPPQPPRGIRHYRDAERMYNSLLAYGFQAADIWVYYNAGAAPPGVGAGLPIDGAATKANFTNFFTAFPGGPFAGQDDQLVIWTADHGGTSLKFFGLVRLNGVGNAAEIGPFAAGNELLDAVNGRFAAFALDSPVLEIPALNSGGAPNVLLAPGESFQVLLNGTVIGSVTYPMPPDGVQLPFAPSLLVSTNSVRFVGSSSSIEVGEFGIHQFTGTVTGTPFDHCTGGSNAGSPCGDATDCFGGSCDTDDAGCVVAEKQQKRCADTVAKAFSKYIKTVAQCHCKQATALFNSSTFDEEDCEDVGTLGKGAKGKFDATIAKLQAGGSCDQAQIDAANAEMAVLSAGQTEPLSLDAQNGAVFCDPTSGTPIANSDPDDAGFVPATSDALKCACGVGKNLARLAAKAIQCHIKLNKAFAKGSTFDEESCEDTNLKGTGGLQKFVAGANHLASTLTCPACLDVPSQTALGTSFLGQVDAANQSSYLCGLP